jgi:hypothetical protein
MPDRSPERFVTGIPIHSTSLSVEAVALSVQRIQRHPSPSLANAVLRVVREQSRPWAAKRKETSAIAKRNVTRHRTMPNRARRYAY